MNVADIMTRSVITVSPDTPVAEAAALMLEHRISGLPVVEPGDKVVGIVTEGDLLRRAETGTEVRHARWLEFLLSPGRLAAEYTDAHARKVSDVMSRDIAFVTPDDDLAAVVDLMERKSIKRVPVTETGRLVGIVSRANLLRALVQSQPAGGGALSDAEIRERVLAEIDRQPWAPRASIDVQVEDGIVDLHGTVTDDRERTALRVVAETLPGVKEVRDHIVWIEPVSGMVVPAPEPEPDRNG